MPFCGQRTGATGSSKAILLKIKQERQDQQFSDFVVCVEGVEFKSHKLILAATSDVFRWLFASNNTETLEGKATLQDVPVYVFESLLRWMYDMEFILTPENVSDIVAAADKLQMQGLRDECKTFIEKALSKDNCVKYYILCQTYKWLQIDVPAWNLMVNNFESLEIADVCALPFRTMQELVASPLLNITCEDSVVKVILGWVKALPEEALKKSCEEKGSESLSTKSGAMSNQNAPESTGRKQRKTGKMSYSSADHGESDVNSPDICPSRADLLIELLKSTRYLRISKGYLWGTLFNEPLIESNPKGRDFLFEILRFLTYKGERQDPNPPAARPRKSYPVTWITNNVVKPYWRDIGHGRRTPSYSDFQRIAIPAFISIIMAFLILLHAIGHKQTPSTRIYPGRDS